MEVNRKALSGPEDSQQSCEAFSRRPNGAPSVLMGFLTPGHALSRTPRATGAASRWGARQSASDFRCCGPRLWLCLRCALALVLFLLITTSLGSFRADASGLVSQSLKIAAFAETERSAIAEEQQSREDALYARGT